MLLSSLRSFQALTQIYRFSKGSDPDFQPQVKPNVTTDNISSIIGKLVNSHDVLLFMKGTVDRPQCGYSNTVVKILKDQGVQNIKGVNILADQIMSNWPTYPQLYVKGKFVGGCDIVREMDSNGSLTELLEINKVI